MNASAILPTLRDLYSKLPEYLDLEAWELQHVLWSLGYTNNLEDEAESSAAVEVARQDWPEWWRAA
jgi:hypothetical protein